jgi:hypothetical protein
VRSRLTLLAVLIGALSLVAFGAVASAKPRHRPPHHNHGLTINATPNPSVTGDALLIYGQLNDTPHSGQTITLWHHIAGSHRGYTRVQRTTTDANGFYSITRAQGVVTTNRSWFVTAGHGVHSRTLYQRVAATVTLSASTTTADTNHRIVFSGHVAPNHAFERVVLQQESGANEDHWQTIDRGRLNASSDYAITHRFLRPGDRTLRVVFRGDRRNTRAESSPVSISVSQTQNAKFTLTPSAAKIDHGQSVTLSGTLSAPNNASVVVTLYAHPQAGGAYHAVTTATTDGSGNYTFAPQSPEHNTVYQARTANGRRSAQVFEGVRDVVTLSVSSTTSQVGQAVTFSGHVDPSKVGHVFVLQRKGLDGDFHTVQSGHIGALSNYAIAHVFATPGVKTYRVFVPGGQSNLAGVSPTVTVTVAPAAASTLPGSDLPPAS